MTLLNPEYETRRKKCRFFDLGFVDDYKVVWDFQKKILQQRIDRSISDSLIFVEHDHVITMGRSSHPENVLIKDLPMYEIERGGDATYHGPGQLVAYPILSLEEKALGIRQYVELLETVVIDALTALGLANVQGKLGKETGVWADNKRKIASIGIAVSHWVSFHGLALNVNTDLSYFGKINPCGYDAGIMTSVCKELNVDRVQMSEVKQLLLGAFLQRFGWSIDNPETAIL